MVCPYLPLSPPPLPAAPFLFSSNLILLSCYLCVFSQNSTYEGKHEIFVFLSDISPAPVSLLPPHAYSSLPVVPFLCLDNAFSNSMSSVHILSIYIKPRTANEKTCDICLKGWLNLPNMVTSSYIHFPASDTLHFSLWLKTIPHCIYAPCFLYLFSVGELFFSLRHYYGSRAELKLTVLTPYLLCAGIQLCTTKASCDPLALGTELCTPIQTRFCCSQMLAVSLPAFSSLVYLLCMCSA